MKHSEGDAKMDIAMRFVFDHTYDSPKKFSYDRSWVLSPERVSQMPHGLLRFLKTRRPVKYVFVDPISEPSVAWGFATFRNRRPYRVCLLKWLAFFYLDLNGLRFVMAYYYRASDWVTVLFSLKLFFLLTLAQVRGGRGAL